MQQDAPRPGPGADPERRHGSMTEAPPWIGGVTISLLFLSAAVLITYTLVPLPGQESLGDLNYLLAGLLFVAHIACTRLYRTRLAQRPAVVGRSAQVTPTAPGAGAAQSPSDPFR